MPTDQSVREVLDQLEAAWNSGDGRAYAAPYAADAQFVTVQGRSITGRDAIGAGHQGIFDTVYAGSTNSMELLSPSRSPTGCGSPSPATPCPSPGPLAGVRQALGTNLLRETEAGWEIVSTQNTIVEERA